jgi:hypothetical protein
MSPKDEWVLATPQPLQAPMQPTHECRLPMKTPMQATRPPRLLAHGR